MKPTRRTVVAIGVTVCAIVVGGGAIAVRATERPAQPSATAASIATTPTSPMIAAGAPSVPSATTSTIPLADGSLAARRDDLPAPVRLRVPAIGVDASVVAVGLTADGAEMDVPEIDKVGWYRFGSKPAEAGTTLMAGHVDGEGRPGVFWSLRNLKRDAVIDVDAGTETKQYRVTSVTKVPKTKLPAEVFRRDGQPALVLVTCGGKFDKGAGHYEDNVVVTAVPV